MELISLSAREVKHEWEEQTLFLLIPSNQIEILKIKTNLQNSLLNKEAHHSKLMHVGLQEI